MNDQRDDRQVIILHGRAEDTARLADAVIEKLGCELFAADGVLYRLIEGKMIQLKGVDLHQLVDEHFSSVQPVNDNGVWKTERCPVTIDPRQGVVDLTGALLSRAARAPSQSRVLSDQLKSEIRSRARSGEPKPVIAKFYGITVDHVSQIQMAR